MTVFHKVGAARKALRCASLLAVAASSGCGLKNEPYYLGRWDTREIQEREVSGYAPPNDPGTGKPLLHVCYNRMIHSPEQVRRITLQNCANPQLQYNKDDLYSCSLMAPIRATFRCDRLSREAAEARPNLRRSESYTGTVQFGIGGGTGQQSNF